jgi:hypothetical protein
MISLTIILGQVPWYNQIDGLNFTVSAFTSTIPGKFRWHGIAERYESVKETS